MGTQKNLTAWRLTYGWKYPENVPNAGMRSANIKRTVATEQARQLSGYNRSHAVRTY